jgi:hypothetical protein
MNRIERPVSPIIIAAIMRKLSTIIWLFLFFGCQNEKGSDKINDKVDSGNSRSAVTNEIIDSTGFIKYWTDFRQAVLNADTNKLITLTDFPLQARGSFDSDPVIEYSKQQFSRVFNFFLEQSVGDGTGSTEFDKIKSQEAPKEKGIHDQIRIGGMIFFLTDKKWKLGFLYLDYDTIDSIKMSK